MTILIFPNKWNSQEIISWFFLADHLVVRHGILSALPINAAFQLGRKWKLTATAFNWRALYMPKGVNRKFSSRSTQVGGVDRINSLSRDCLFRIVIKCRIKYVLCLAKKCYLSTLRGNISKLVSVAVSFGLHFFLFVKSSFVLTLKSIVGYS
jgi:hypothetical protein